MSPDTSYELTAPRGQRQRLCVRVLGGVGLGEYDGVKQRRRSSGARARGLESPFSLASDPMGPSPGRNEQESKVVIEMWDVGRIRPGT
ncbi:hypothetical protein KUCAC02_016509, partial [Chaenocephalus aceratus]